MRSGSPGDTQQYSSEEHSSQTATDRGSTMVNAPSSSRHASNRRPRHAQDGELPQVGGKETHSATDDAAEVPPAGRDAGPTRQYSFGEQ
jgi:hypothetical protein